jgi:aryl-alcohol dehydrogenase-like predicted oxidoreductase
MSTREQLETGSSSAALQVRHVLDPIATRHGATISQITLAWLLARSPVIMPIPGTTSVAHLRENLDSQDMDLRPEDIESINGSAAEPTAISIRAVATGSQLPVIDSS